MIQYLALIAVTAAIILISTGVTNLYNAELKNGMLVRNDIRYDHGIEEIDTPSEKITALKNQNDLQPKTIIPDVSVKVGEFTIGEIIIEPEKEKSYCHRST